MILNRSCYYYFFRIIAVAFVCWTGGEGENHGILLTAAETPPAQEEGSHSIISTTLPVFQDSNANQIDHRKMVGVIRYHYDATVNTCEHVLLLGVGTFMSVGDYDKISEAVAANQPIVVAFVDHNVDNFEKTSPSKYASLTNEIVNQLDTLMPICSRGIKARILIGGHSASGQAAMQAWQQGLIDKSRVKPVGFVGLDPYQISEKTMDESIVFDLPGLYWGFTRTTCLVTVQKAAQAAYEITETNARVLYSIHNDNHEKEMTHCVFTDQGCGVSPVGCSTQIDFGWVYGKVADSIHLYLQSLMNSALFNRGHFILPKSFDEVIDVHVNKDIALIHGKLLADEWQLIEEQ